MKYHTHYSESKAYETKDGSTIRELLHPNLHANEKQSLAEAIVPVNGKTLLHKHNNSEELYHITQGSGLMILGNEQFEIQPG